MEAVISQLIRFLTELAITAGVIYGIFRNSRVAMIDKVGEAAVDHANANAVTIQTTGESLNLHNRAINELIERDYEYVKVMRELTETKEELQSLRKMIETLKKELATERQLREILQKELDQERKRRYIPPENGEFDLDKTDPVPFSNEE